MAQVGKARRVLQQRLLVFAIQHLARFIQNIERMRVVFLHAEHGGDRVQADVYNGYAVIAIFVQPAYGGEHIGITFLLNTGRKEHAAGHLKIIQPADIGCGRCAFVVGQPCQNMPCQRRIKINAFDALVGIQIRGDLPVERSLGALEYVGVREKGARIVVEQ